VRVRLVGTVVAFDDAVGLGEVETAGVAAGADSRAGAGVGSGAGAGAGPVQSVRYRFHCTQIADGSRTVEVGTVVTFGLLAGHGGRWEAADLQLAAAGHRPRAR
jgi:hypothetical protein